MKHHLSFNGLCVAILLWVLAIAQAVPLRTRVDLRVDVALAEEEY